MYLASIHNPLPTAANTRAKSNSANPWPICWGVTYLESIFTEEVMIVYAVKIHNTAESAYTGSERIVRSQVGAFFISTYFLDD
jgi:hypothetical protein